MQVVLEFRKFVEETIEYHKDGKAQSFERKLVMFEDEAGDQVRLRFADVSGFKGISKGQAVRVSFKVNDKGLLVDSKLVGLSNGNGQGK
jgi:hypothetical protein